MPVHDSSDPTGHLTHLVTTPLLILMQPASAAATTGPLAQLFASVPEWLWYIVGVVVFFAIAGLVWAIWSRQRAKTTVEAVIASFKGLGKADDDDRRYGRTLTAVDAWRATHARLTPRARSLVAAIESELVEVDDPRGERRYKLAEDVASRWTPDQVIPKLFSIELLDAIPGMLTALGLIGTFVAIALGLGGLSQEANGVIRGVETLLGGLGGKFISSIVALGCALLVQAIDSIWLRDSLRTLHERLLQELAVAFPRITMSQQLSDLLRSARRQESSLSNISSDVVDRFADVFNTDLLPALGHRLAESMDTQMGPVLERVASGITALDEGIRRLESGKQESIGTELRNLTTSLEEAIRVSLQQMGDDFRAALSGSADDEFKKASAALNTSAAVLGGLNESFVTMQSSMQRLMEDAERRASRSFEEGEGRTRALNELVERLIAQLSDQAANSAGEVQRVMVEAIASMGNRMTQLTADMEACARTASAQSMAANQRLLDQVTSAAGRTTTETERLLATLAERSDDFTGAADTLRELREGTARILAETGGRVRELQDAATAFRAVATEAATLTRALRDAQDQQRVTTESAAGMVTTVGAVVERQRAIVDRTSQTLELSTQVLSELDDRLGKVLTVILERLQAYNQAVENNIREIMKHVNDGMPQMHELLQSSLGQLSESIEELSAVMGRNGQGSR